MAQSSITLPIAVEDKAALTELKRIQTALGAVGKESASLNKAISDSMEGMASKLSKSFGDVASKSGGVGGSGMLGKATQLAFSFNEIGQAIEKVGALISKAAEYGKFAGDLERMQKAIPTESLKQMQIATSGTVDKVKLLQFGMSALQGSFHLTQSGINLVLQAAQNLHQQGFGPTVEIAKKLEEALRTGNNKALEEFGIKANNAKQAMDGFRKVAAEHVNVDPGLQAIERLQTKVEDFKTAWKKALGDLATDIAILIDNALEAGDIASAKNRRQVRAAQLFEQRTGRAYGSGGTAVQTALGPEVGGFVRNITAGTMGANMSFEGAAGQATMDQALKDIELQDAKNGLALANFYSIQAIINAKAAKYIKMTKGTPPSQGGGSTELGFFDSFIGKFTRPAWGYNLGQAANEIVSDQQWQETQNGITNAAGAFGKFAGGIGGALEAGVGANDKRARDRQDQLDLLKSQLDDTSNVAGAAFQTLSQGLTAAVDAAISGSDSIGKAAMKAAATVLKSIALQAVGRAAFEVALAIAEPPLAGQHLAAAAKFGVAAALAGGLAAAAGSAASGGGGGGGASAGRSGAGSAAGVVTPNVQQGAQSQTIIVNVTGATTSGDYQKLGETITKAIDAGKQAGRVRSDSSVTVRYE